MKETLYYAYHLEIDSIEEYEEYSSFSWNNKKYYFMVVRRDKNEIDSIIKITIELLSMNIPVFPIIKNLSGEYTTKVGDNYYVLLEVSNELKEYDLESILKRMDLLRIKPLNNNLRRDNWANLWIEKVDYMEYQVHELGNKYKEIVKTFTYFKGLAENAICYLKQVERKYKQQDNYYLTICHKRIFYPNNRLYYDNSLNFVIDLEVRDIAELLKSEMLENVNLALSDLKYYLNVKKPSLYLVSLLYARLIYPSYYFDEHELIINNNKDVKKLLLIIDKINNIQVFLKDSYYIINEYMPIEKVEWLLKKEL